LNRNYNYVLAPKVFCGCSHSRAVIEGDHYVCPSQDGVKKIRMDVLDPIILECAIEFLTLENIAKIAKIVSQEYAKEKQGRLSLASFEARLQTCMREKEKLMARIEDGNVSESELARALELKKEEIQLQALIEQEKKESIVLSESMVMDRLKEVQENVRTDPKYAWSLIDLLIDSITLYEDSALIRFNTGETQKVNTFD